MASLVEQLQADAINPSVRVGDLLRKAKIVASKLDLPEFESWVDTELNGYPQEQPVPSYRHVYGVVICLNPFRGWQPVNFGEKAANISKQLSENSNYQPVSEIEDLVVRDGGSGEFHIPFGTEIAARLCQAMKIGVTQVALRVDRSGLVGILEAVRNAVLQWSLKLEKTGIVGQGLSFSESERQRAHEPSVVYQIGRIENFSGNIGAVSSEATVTAYQTIGTPIADLRALVEQITKHVESLGLESAARERFEQTIRSLQAELDTAKPERGRISQLLRSMKSILEEAAGNIVASGILAHLDKIPL
ncbi:MAG: hypothetical protein AB7S71_00645 [Dongiaceae bacterium]